MFFNANISYTELAPDRETIISARANKCFKSSWHLFVIKIANRDELYYKLKEKGISTSMHFIHIHHFIF